MNRSVRWVTIRYSLLYYVSEVKTDFRSFQSERFKRFAHPFWRVKIFCKMKGLYRLSFQRLAKVGVMNIVHSTLLGSQITNKRCRQFWRDGISLQNEIPEIP